MLSDSRCPTDVVCVWAGDATVKITLSKPPNRAEFFELHTLPGAPTAPGFSGEAIYANYTISLLNLAPLPRTGTKIDPKDYVATFVVRRR